jgi:alcohol dehydrogenase
MAKAMGKENATNPMDFVDMLVRLQESCGVSDLKMSDYCITKEEIPTLAKNARETMGALFEVDPMPVTLEDSIKIYEASYK